MMKTLRGRKLGPFGRKMSRLCVRQFGVIANMTRLGLVVGGLAQTLVGARFLNRVSKWLNTKSNGRLPLWPLAMPRAAPPVAVNQARAENDLTVVYYPSCASRTMGPAAGDAEDRSLPETMMSLFAKAGVNVVVPGGLEKRCCGMPFESKGSFEDADLMRDELEAALWRASSEGQYPVVFDTSPCVQRVRQKAGGRIKPLDITDALNDLLLQRLSLTPAQTRAGLHVTCSGRRMGLEQKLRAIVAACGVEAFVPDDIQCCGWAGDKGFFNPDLNASALRQIDDVLPGDIKEGYSSSRTCEIGLSSHAKRPYRSIAYLVDRVSGPGAAP